MAAALPPSVPEGSIIEDLFLDCVANECATQPFGPSYIDDEGDPIHDPRMDIASWFRRNYSRFSKDELLRLLNSRGVAYRDPVTKSIAIPSSISEGVTDVNIDSILIRLLIASGISNAVAQIGEFPTAHAGNHHMEFMRRFLSWMVDTQTPEWRSSVFKNRDFKVNIDTFQAVVGATHNVPIAISQVLYTKFNMERKKLAAFIDTYLAHLLMNMNQFLDEDRSFLVNIVVFMNPVRKVSFPPSSDLKDLQHTCSLLNGHLIINMFQAHHDLAQRAYRSWIIVDERDGEFGTMEDRLHNLERFIPGVVERCRKKATEIIPVSVVGTPST